MLTANLLQANAGGGGYSGILMIVAMVVIFYFFMIRPQSKKQKELKKAREALERGSKVVTAGGIHGRIKDIKDDVMSIEIAPNVTIKVDKASIYPVAQAPAGDKVKDEDKK
ncbi:MAG: preprotein translocase subunit YajC [Muribaculaceae bacterium]|nr:preprotein translocase subunit YajC [Muribaculaceae bacterium]